MAAAGMALSGQTVECFAMLRLCLECSGYALLIFNDPKLEIIFMERHANETGKKAQKKEFLIGTVTKIIKKYDAKLADIFQEMYDRSIDFGGHPNQHALFSAITMNKTEAHTEISTLALQSDPNVTLHALKSTAQVGLTALHVFQHIFKEKFELLSIRAELNNLRKAGL